ncbi:MAG TPA: hypothetical protein VM779_14255 [Thermoanaerobaculia bacterium]|nr:hypothetical protein [Thermoanaerobaculia bacterium]
MNDRRIDDDIREYYEAKELSPAALERLKQTIRTASPIRPPRRHVWPAAAAVAAALLMLVWLASQRVPATEDQLAAAVAQEAALGHNEKQELEFRVDDCAELQHRMKSLDFTPVEPQMMRHRNMRIVGARYSTLAGQMAAQIVYVDAQGVPCTLFQARPGDRLTRLSEGEHEVDGVHVKVWREKGLLMVLARPMA